MRKLSKGQLVRASEIFGNLAVAWFSAGAISPVITKPSSLTDFLLTFVLSLIWGGIFFALALELAEDKK